MSLHPRPFDRRKETIPAPSVANDAIRSPEFELAFSTKIIVEALCNELVLSGVIDGELLARSIDSSHLAYEKRFGQFSPAYWPGPEIQFHLDATYKNLKIVTDAYRKLQDLQPWWKRLFSAKPRATEQ